METTQPTDDTAKKIPTELANKVEKVKQSLVVQEQEVMSLKGARASLTSEIRQLIEDKKVLEEALISIENDKMSNKEKLQKLTSECKKSLDESSRLNVEVKELQAKKEFLDNYVATAGKRLEEEKIVFSEREKILNQRIAEFDEKEATLNIRIKRINEAVIG